MSLKDSFEEINKSVTREDKCPIYTLEDHTHDQSDLVVKTRLEFITGYNVDVVQFRKDWLFVYNTILNNKTRDSIESNLPIGDFDDFCEKVIQMYKG